MHWLYRHGFEPEQVTADCGIDVGGGRQPDLTVWSKDRPPRRVRSSYAGRDGLLLAVEVVAQDSELTDRVIRKTEYATAGVPRCWVVDRDRNNTVQMYQLVDGAYEQVDEARSLAWLLNGLVPDLG